MLVVLSQRLHKNKEIFEICCSVFLMISKKTKKKFLISTFEIMCA